MPLGDQACLPGSQKGMEGLGLGQVSFGKIFLCPGCCLGKQVCHASTQSCLPLTAQVIADTDKI